MLYPLLRRPLGGNKLLLLLLARPENTEAAHLRPLMVQELPAFHPRANTPDDTVAWLAVIRRFLQLPTTHILYVLPAEGSPVYSVLQTVSVTSVLHGQLTKFSLPIAFRLSWVI